MTRRRVDKYTDVRDGQGQSIPLLTLACIGLAFHSVVGIFDFSPTLCLQPSAEASAWMAALKPLSRFGNIATLLCFALYAYRAGPLHQKWGFVVAMGVAYTSGLMLILYFGVEGAFSNWGLVLGVLLKSVGACFLVFWGEIIVRFSIFSIVVTAASSYLLCFCMVAYFSLAKGIATSVVISLLPLISMALVLCSSAEQAQPALSDKMRPSVSERPRWRSLPAKQLVAIGIFGAAQLLVNEISEMRIDYSVEANTIVAGVLGSLVMVLLALISGRRFRVVFLSRILIPTLIVAMLVVLIAEPGFQRYESFALGGGYAVFRIFVFCLWCYFGKNSALGVSVVVAVGQAVLVMCNWLEEPLELLLVHSGMAESVVVAAVVAVCLVVAIFMLNDNDILDVRSPVDISSEEEDETSAEARLLVIGQQLGLTQREREICFLLERGRATDEICKELFISQATLKTHMRNIYRKVGVHSRPELTALLKNRNR